MGGLYPGRIFHLVRRWEYHHIPTTMIGVVEIAGAKVGPALQEEIKPVRCFQRIAIAVEVVTAKFIDNEDHDQLGLAR